LCLVFVNLLRSRNSHAVYFV